MVRTYACCCSPVNYTTVSFEFGFYSMREILWYRYWFTTKSLYFRAKCIFMLNNSYACVCNGIFILSDINLFVTSVCQYRIIFGQIKYIWMISVWVVIYLNLKFLFIWTDFILEQILYEIDKFRIDIFWKLQIRKR